MPLKRLNSRFVETVIARNKRLEIRDEVVRGLELRVTTTGVKSWSVLYTRTSDGKKRRVGLGGFPAISLNDARTQAKDVIAKVARGADPANAASERRQGLTFKELSDEWIEEHAEPNLSPGSLANARSMLRRHVLLHIGGMKVDEVRRRDIVLMLNSVKRAEDGRFEAQMGGRSEGRSRKRRGNPTVLAPGRRVTHQPNRVFELVRSIFRWGMGQDLLKIDSVAGMQPPIKNLTPRDRFLTCNEVVTIWSSLDQAAITPGLSIALRLSLVTAQRIGEITATAKRDIDLDSQCLPFHARTPRTRNLIACPSRPSPFILFGRQWLFPGIVSICSRRRCGSVR
jgi:hypothetical protein